MIGNEDRVTETEHLPGTAAFLPEARARWGRVALRLHVLAHHFPLGYHCGTIPGFRWLTIAPTGQESPEIVLLKSQDPAVVRRGTTWVLETDDCRKTYKEHRSRGVTFCSVPEEAPWGVSAVFEDLYGNPNNLVEPRWM